MKANKITTILVDDDIRALNRLKILLNNFSNIEIIGLIQDSEKSVDYILTHEPDLVFLDIEMPEKSGLDIADEINKNNSHTRIIFITSYDHYAIKAIRKLAFDYLLKPVSIDELKDAIDRYETTIKLILNKRELDIIKLISKGKTSKEIGEALFASRHTIDTYRRKILEKTDCSNSAELIMYATKNNLV